MGSRILAGRYELIERIGEGGMAVVFKSRDRLLNRLVAIKVLRPEYTSDSMFVESFRRESQIAANLVHPNIVNIFDVGKQGNIYYIVMELIDGKPLSEIIREEGALEPRWAAGIAKEIASALSLAHKSQLIHRDVKPHNILITKDGVAKIADFGIAKAVSRETFAGEQKSAIMGSVHYFSPEQARGGYVDERSDIYSLGIVLYEMLTGKVPFDGETAVEVAVKHMNEQMTPPSAIKPDIPKDLEDIILKATDKLQVNRYRNADEMITALNFVKFSRHSESTGASAALVAAHGAEAEMQRSASVKAQENDSEDQTSSEEESGSAQESEAESRKERKNSQTPLYRRKWFQRVCALLLAVLLAFPVSKLIYKLYSSSAGEESEPGIRDLIPTSQNEFEVPDLQNKDFETERAALALQGITLEVQMELVSKDKPAGTIMSQTPTSGSKIKTGQTIRVSVSKGDAAAVVPDVIGKSYASAKLVIESYGYEVGDVTYSYSDTVKENTVISTSPEKGTGLGEGKPVDLVVSQGPEPKEEEPEKTLNLIGLEYEKAEEMITSGGYTVGSVMYTSNISVPEGCVISQEPGASEALADGCAIDLVVSNGTGKSQEEVPPEEGEGETEGTEEAPGIQTGQVSIPVDFTTAAEDIFFLTVNVSDDVNGSRTPIVKQQTEKAEGSRIIHVTGSGANGRVVIRFDNDIAYDLTVNFETGEYY